MIPIFYKQTFFPSKNEGTVKQKKKSAPPHRRWWLGVAGDQFLGKTELFFPVCSKRGSETITKNNIKKWRGKKEYQQINECFSFIDHPKKIHTDDKWFKEGRWCTLPRRTSSCLLLRNQNGMPFLVEALKEFMKFWRKQNICKRIWF